MMTRPPSEAPSHSRILGALGIALLAVTSGTLVAAPGAAQPIRTIDLATVSTDSQLHRLFGSVGTGRFGVPVAGGFDADGDGHADYAMAAMTASPPSRNLAGQIFLVFGDGRISGSLDTADPNTRILTILGDAVQENAGSEIWMDDVTGDGLGDLLICRQNFNPGGRIGAGALTIVPGSAALRTKAETLEALDLRAPDAALDVTTLVGPTAGARLGIWVRTGDVTGDGIADLVVGADQEQIGGSTHAGAVWLIRGGAHLVEGGEIDLADFGDMAFDLAGLAAKILPPSPDDHDHFSATVQVADLDGNDKSEVLAAAALNRAGAGLDPVGGSGDGIGGTPRGTLFILWDDLFAGVWPDGFTVQFGDSPGSETRIDGATTASWSNLKFGEEIVGGHDYDNDGQADLFAGDITGVGPNGANSGLAFVFWDASLLKGKSFDTATLPDMVDMTTFYGPSSGAIGGDTAADGDFDGDGIADLMLSSPHDSPLGRASAGTMHIVRGREGGWPAVIDLKPGSHPPSTEVEIVEVYGANRTLQGDNGDTLCYSAAAGDLDGDGRIDLVTNEMLGNSPTADDTGNLILVSGDLLFPPIFDDGFESGDTSVWSNSVP